MDGGEDNNGDGDCDDDGDEEVKGGSWGRMNFNEILAHLELCRLGRQPAVTMLWRYCWKSKWVRKEMGAC